MIISVCGYVNQKRGAGLPGFCLSSCVQHVIPNEPDFVISNAVRNLICYV